MKEERSITERIRGKEFVPEKMPWYGKVIIASCGLILFAAFLELIALMILFIKLL